MKTSFEWMLDEIWDESFQAGKRGVGTELWARFQKMVSLRFSLRLIQNNRTNFPLPHFLGTLKEYLKWFDRETGQKGFSLRSRTEPAGNQCWEKIGFEQKSPRDPGKVCIHNSRHIFLLQNLKNFFLTLRPLFSYRQLRGKG